jgi:signal transduction histidine kinase/ActR/RegA family two-component response regulator
MERKLSRQPHRQALICTADKKEIPALKSALAGYEADAVVCLDISELLSRISEQTEAIAIIGDDVSEEAISRLAEALDSQPEWSDLPVLISVPDGADSSLTVVAQRELGNVLMLDYPFTPGRLNNAFQVAFRSRERQRWLRELMNECEKAVQDLRDSRDQLEQSVRERTSELEERASQLRNLTGALILSEHRERNRLAKILHDNLQQLLVSAKYRVAFLSKSDDPKVTMAAQEIEGLLSEVIEVSRSLTSELSPPIAHESELRAGLERLAGFMAAQSALAVKLKIEEDLDQIEPNMKILLFESIRELLVNVVKHAHTQSAEVRIRRAGGNILEISVADRGSGFNPDDVKKKGFGLLRIRERLELIGGQLEMESAPGEGSRFMIRVPIGLVGIRTVESAPQTERTIPRPKSLVSSVVRLLVADDHAVMRQGLASSLGQEPDMVIVGEAADGRMAVEKARSLQPDVVLMDIGMPKMGGIEATRLIHSEMPNIRVIGLSMFEEKEQANAMFEAGAVAYLSKSSSVDALTATIRKCIGKPELPARNR